MHPLAVHSGRQRRPQAIFEVSCAIFLGATFFEVGVTNNAVISDNRMSIEKTGIFWLLTMLV